MSSPPERITARRPCALSSRASCAWSAATSRASPSRSVAEQDAARSPPRASAASPPQARRPAGRRARNAVPAKIGSPGFGVSLAASASARAPLAAGRADSARRWRAHRPASSGSGTVGPEPITAGSSPGTSEIASVTSRGRCGARGEPAALDAREMLAHGVDLADRGAGAQQCPRHRLLLRQRQARGRRDPVGRGAARQQHQHQVVGGRRGRRARASRSAAGESGRVGHRMAGLDHRARAAVGRAVAVAGHGKAGKAVRRQAAVVEIVALRDFASWSRRPCRRRAGSGGPQAAVAAGAPAGRCAGCAAATAALNRDSRRHGRGGHRQSFAADALDTFTGRRHPFASAPTATRVLTLESGRCRHYFRLDIQS